MSFSRFILAFALLLPLSAPRADSLPPLLPPAQALSMQGTAKEAPGFTHFPYANPDAPHGGELRLGVSGSFDSLNPFIVRGTPPLGLVTGTMSFVFESLLTRSWDEPFTLYSLLAESVEVAEDRSALVFNLNPRARFSDGTPVTADDVIFSFETLRDQGRPNHRLYYKKVARAEVLSPTRVLFVFKRNAAGRIDREMPLIMGLMPVLPRHDWQGKTFNQTTLRPLIGSGPYKIDSVDVGHTLTYRRNEAYWGRDLPTQRGLFNFDTVRVDFYRDDSVALQAFKAGRFDLRRESDPKKWATAYESAALADGRIQLDKFSHHRTEPVRGLILNLRHPLFADPTLRLALAYAFDSGWINRTLFRGAFERTNSFFPNSELASDPFHLPEGKERALLEELPSSSARTALTTPVILPQTDGTEQSLRTNLRTAADLLKQSGYKLVDAQLQTPSGAPVSFDVMLADPSEEKIALEWARALQTLGITARVRTVDSAQYQARLAEFDFDVTINAWNNSLSPGNEQSLYWGRASANQKGSRNYAGLSDPAIDALASKIPEETSREDLIAATHALDRLLLQTHAVIPFFYQTTDKIAHKTSLHAPAFTPLYGPVLESWWK